MEKPKEIEKVLEDEVTEPEPPIQVHVEPIVAEVDVPIGNGLHFVTYLYTRWRYIVFKTNWKYAKTYQS